MTSCTSLLSSFKHQFQFILNEAAVFFLPQTQGEQCAPGSLRGKMLRRGPLNHVTELLISVNYVSTAWKVHGKARTLLRESRSTPDL